MLAILLGISDQWMLGGGGESADSIDASRLHDEYCDAVGAGMSDDHIHLILGQVKEEVMMTMMMCD